MGDVVVKQPKVDLLDLHDFSDEAGELACDRTRAIDEQDRTAEFVELDGANALPVCFSGVVANSGGKTGHEQGGELEGEERNPVVRVRNSELQDGRDEEKVETEKACARTAVASTTLPRSEARTTRTN